MLHQNVRSVKVGDLSAADKARYGLVGLPDSEFVAISEDQPAPVVSDPPMVPPEPPAELPAEQAG